MARGSADRDAIVAAPRQPGGPGADAWSRPRGSAPTEHPITLDAPDTVEIVADPLRIEQVLTNLVDNAVKYSPAGSTIEVAVRPGPDCAELMVRDHGMGIPPEHQQRIFDRFFQAHVGEHASGMGLGLYISQEIVRHHGGTIRVEAPEDGGTRMIVRLPREAAPTRRPEPSSVRRPAVGVTTRGSRSRTRAGDRPIAASIPYYSVAVNLNTLRMRVLLSPWGAALKRTSRRLPRPLGAGPGAALLAIQPTVHRALADEPVPAQFTVVGVAAATLRAERMGRAWPWRSCRPGAW